MNLLFFFLSSKGRLSLKALIFFRSSFFLLPTSSGIPILSNSQAVTIQLLYLFTAETAKIAEVINLFCLVEIPNPTGQKEFYAFT